jgi:Icc-related predicted phosphoesterase
MAVYVDDAFIPYGRMKMCHMVADQLGELHHMADVLDLNRKHFQDRTSHPHYDISKGFRERAIKMGAKAISKRELVKIIKRLRRKPNTIRIVAIADTHGRYEHIDNLPDGDILVVAGDSLGIGKYWWELVAVGEWLDKQPYEHIILIAGNHDFILNKMMDVVIQQHLKRTHYLEDTPLRLRGLNFYGVPWTPHIGPQMNWAFTYKHDSVREKMVWEQIPQETDVLITHGPAHGILDAAYGGHIGCKVLSERIKRLPHLKAHIFGQAHESYGQQGISYNVSIVAAPPHYPVNLPAIIDIPIPPPSPTVQFSS